MVTYEALFSYTIVIFTILAFARNSKNKKK